MYEVVKTVNGHDIVRMKGSQRFYWVRIDQYRSVHFYTIKAAVEYINKTLSA